MINLGVCSAGAVSKVRVAPIYYEFSTQKFQFGTVTRKCAGNIQVAI